MLYIYIFMLIALEHSGLMIHFMYTDDSDTTSTPAVTVSVRYSHSSVLLDLGSI